MLELSIHIQREEGEDLVSDFYLDGYIFRKRSSKWHGREGVLENIPSVMREYFTREYKYATAEEIDGMVSGNMEVGFYFW